jgi:hypothetical protein
MMPELQPLQPRSADEFMLGEQNSLDGSREQLVKYGLNRYQAIRVVAMQKTTFSLMAHPKFSLSGP